jgi:hypothetical protein
VPDTPIAELRGISQGAIVALTRMSISTIESLLKADFHEVAYALDSYDDAEELMRTAMKYAKTEAPTTTTTAKGAAAKGKNQKRTRQETAKKQPPQKPQPKQQRREAKVHMELVGSALAAVWDDLCEGKGCAEAFDELIRRIEQARLVAELDEDGAATAAALACDETGSPIEGTPDEIAELIAGAEELLVVSMTPGSGRKAHCERVEEASETVRLLVSARALSSVRQILAELDKKGVEIWDKMDAGREGTLWYYRTMIDSLAAAGKTPLTDELKKAVEQLEKVPVAKAA